MKHKICVAVLLLVWAALTGFAWFAPAKEISEAERRPLDQMPAFTTQTVLDGSFMTDFEGYTLDQFPLRDRFRQLKALFHYNALQQQDKAQQCRPDAQKFQRERDVGKRAGGQEKRKKHCGYRIFPDQMHGMCLPVS